MNDREFWIQVRRGLLTVVSAIEYRWNLPRGGGFTLGATPPPEASPQSEPPLAAPAQASEEMSRDAVQQR
jgi:hypothetical protein